MADDPHVVPAFLVYADENAHQRTYVLGGSDRLQIGRGESAGLRLAWDREVSRIHAELQWLGDGWAIIDDGLSANGTAVNGDRLLGRRRLSSGDEIRVGATRLVFRSVTQDSSATFIPSLRGPAIELSRMQTAVLIALCRPYREPATRGQPATNQQIADETHVSVAAVKTHLRALFAKFAIADLPQNQKRARLASLAFERGLVSERAFTE